LDLTHAVSGAIRRPTPGRGLNTEVRTSGHCLDRGLGVITDAMYQLSGQIITRDEEARVPTTTTTDVVTAFFGDLDGRG